jgi:tetraacyldisaccharide 4'-kinase
VNLLLQPLAGIFRVGVALRHAAYRMGWLKTQRLSRPVISVGNLTVGGTGKTPLVATIAQILQHQGLKPSVLTRGYGRENEQDLIVIEPGAARPPEAREVGDEPALLARMLPEVPIVLCADRFRAGQAAEECFQVDAHILDDGFQHLALARDLDLVALDATQPISNWRLLPAGRQREPLSALRRAQIVVITRSDSADSKPLEALVMKASPKTKIFRSQTVLRGWADTWSGEPIPHSRIHGQKVAAFCGIGNPDAFFADLRRWGFDLVGKDAFPDHHIYTDGEIQRFTAAARKNGATALLTTQKDAVKFSREWTPQLPILSCEIESQIQDAEDFEKTLLSAMRKGKP